jgi:hypothetical protein
MIERLHAHSKGNNGHADKNCAEFLLERKRMMQAWGDYLAAIRSDARVIHMRAAVG